MEDIWRCMRQNWFANRVFVNFQAFLNERRNAWNKLTESLGTIASIGSRKWALTGQH